MRKLRLLVVAIVMSTVAAVPAVASAASSPSVATGPHSHPATTSAVISGTVNPNGSGTTYVFEWGLTNAYGLASAAHSAGHGTAPVTVRTTVRGLIPGTEYHYRLVAVNRFGTTAGSDRTLKTAGHPPPGVTTGPASVVGKNSATLTAVVNPEGEATTWEFQYGPTTAYGSQTFSETVPAGSAPVVVSATISGIEAQTIFHYRAVAQHGPYVTPGLDATFMTYPLSPPAPRVRAFTSPHFVPSEPFVFTTSGYIAGPSWIPGAYDCTGDVAIRFFLGRREVGSTLAAVQPNCTYAGQVAFSRLPGRGKRGRHVVLWGFVRFLGNGYLATAHARPRAVTLG